MDLKSKLQFLLPQISFLLDNLDIFIKKSSIEVVFKDDKIEINSKDLPVEGLNGIRVKILEDIPSILIKLTEANHVLLDVLDKEKNL